MYIYTCLASRPMRQPWTQIINGHVKETYHGRFRERCILSQNYGITSRHRASRNITNVMESIMAHHGAKPITDNHGMDAVDCCQGASRREASAKWKLVVRQKHSSTTPYRGSQHTMENHRNSRNTGSLHTVTFTPWRSRNIMDIT